MLPTPTDILCATDRGKREAGSGKREAGSGKREAGSGSNALLCPHTSQYERDMRHKKSGAVSSTAFSGITTEAFRGCEANPTHPVFQ
ncbi:hypothetical protein [Acetobacter tropicalis]|uniref:hypothetical protein n=1 Tax=Acetobacter tropicalis TaxID=104102 RepID=UPI0016569E8B|nr:hypothetical protein [Acetobacter tropicalis]MBC9007369.1 hypothetical protein [Acetobacter tropicalis]